LFDPKTPLLGAIYCWGFLEISGKIFLGISLGIPGIPGMGPLGISGSLGIPGDLISRDLYRYLRGARKEEKKGKGK